MAGTTEGTGRTVVRELARKGMGALAGIAMLASVAVAALAGPAPAAVADEAGAGAADGNATASSESTASDAIATYDDGDNDGDLSAECLFTPINTEDDLVAMIADAREKDTFILCADITLTKPLEMPAGKQITIDLWFFTLETDGNAIKVPSGASLTMRSSTAKAGTVSNSVAASSKTDQHPMFSVAEGGQLGILSGSYTTKSSQIVASSGTAIVRDGTFASTATTDELKNASGKALFTISGEQASLDFTGGSIDASTVDLNNGYALYGVYAANGATVTLGTAASGTQAASGPSIVSGYAAVGLNNTTSSPAVAITVNGGTYKAGLTGVSGGAAHFNSVFYLSGSATVTVNGGEFAGTDPATTTVFALPYTDAGTSLSVTGGTFADARAVIASYAKTGASGTGANALAVSGGTFNAPFAAFASGAEFTGFVTGGTFAASAKPDDATLASGFAFVKNDDGTYGVQTAPESNTVATLTDPATGETTTYETLAEAVDAANATSGATLTLVKSVADRPSVTFTSPVTVTAPAQSAASTTGASAEDASAADASATPTITFNGEMIFDARATVSNIAFTLDGSDLTFANGAVASGTQNSIVLNAGAANSEITGNAFTIPSVDKGAVDFQLTAIRVNRGMSGANIHANAFLIGRSYYNSAVGVNLIGSAAPNAVVNTTVAGNTVTFTKDVDGYTNPDSGSAMFVVANGNAKGGYGVQGLTVAGNTVDGSALGTRDYAVAVSDVNGLTFERNTVTGTYMVISPSYYGGAAYPSTGVQVLGNTLTDNVATVYFGTFFKAGAMGADDIAYGSGESANRIAVSSFRAVDPYVSGMAFVGWYADADFTTVASDADAAAYAKLVPVSDVIAFQGGSLRIDASNGADFAKTSLRFGYHMNTAVEGLTYRSAGWSYTIGGKSYTASAKNPFVDADGGFVMNNLVFTGVPVASYAADIAVRMSVKYVTADGTAMTVQEDGAQSRSVAQVARAIVADASAGEVIKAYAQGVLDALGAQAQ